MKAKKQLLIIILFTSIFMDVTGQEQNAYSKFVSLFPIREYPFSMSYDYERMTPYERPLSKIPSNLSEKFIEKQKVKIRTISKCKNNGFKAFSRFETKNTNFDLLFIIIEIQEGCGEQEYLATYDKNGILIDTLTVAGWWMTKPSTPENQWGESCYLECTIYSDSIVLNQKDYIGLRIKLEDGRTKRNIIISNYTYQINELGYFVKIHENRKEDIEIKNPFE